MPRSVFGADGLIFAFSLSFKQSTALFKDAVSMATVFWFVAVFWFVKKNVCKNIKTLFPLAQCGLKSCVRVLDIMAVLESRPSRCLLP